MKKSYVIDLETGEIFETQKIGTIIFEKNIFIAIGYKTAKKISLLIKAGQFRKAIEEANKSIEELYI